MLLETGGDIPGIKCTCFEFAAHLGFSIDKSGSRTCSCAFGSSFGNHFAAQRITFQALQRCISLHYEH